MSHLVYVPFLKLFRSKSFWMMFLIPLGLLVCSLWVLTTLTELEMNGGKVSIHHLLDFPHVFQNIAWFVKWTNYFFAFILIWLITTDFETRQFRQHLITGWSIENALASYVLVAFIFAVFAVLLDIGLSFLFGMRSSDNPVTLIHLKNIATFFMQCFFTNLFALLLAVFSRRAIPTIMTFMGWVFVMEPFTGWLVDKNIRRGYSELFPFHVSDKLILDPFVEGLMSPKMAIHQNIIFVSAGYIGLFILLSWAKLKFSDH